MTVLIVLMTIVLIIEGVVLFELCKWVNRIDNDIKTIEKQMRIKEWLYDVENGIER